MNDRHISLLLNVNWPSHSWDMANQHFTLKIHIWGHACDQRLRLHCWLGNLLIYFLFISHQSALPFLRYSYLENCPWNSKVKVMVKVKPGGYIWNLQLNQYVCFLLRSNQTIFGWNIANSYLTLKIQGQGHSQCQTRCSYLRPVASEVNLGLAKWPLVFNGRLANPRLTSLVK